MAVDIEEAEIRHLGVITVDFPLRGDVDLVVASRMMKHVLAEQWPEQSRWDQSVYVVRVRGPGRRQLQAPIGDNYTSPSGFMTVASASL